MFALEVEYLLGRSFAGSFQDRKQSEWPPHSGRLFSGLAASYFENGANLQERQALEWLERQAPPGIRAGEPGESSETTAFVPTNYPGDSVPALRGAPNKQPRTFPAQGPSDAVVQFIWGADPPPEILRALDQLAARTAYLGKACSVVRMRVTEPAGLATFVPNATGGLVLRVPSAGRLAELERLYRADQPVSPGAQQRYARSSENSSQYTIDSYFGPMFVYRKVSGPGLPIEGTLTVTEAVRAALLQNADGHGPIPGVLNGHERGSHCAIAALPFAGTEHADGKIMGFAVMLPRDADLDSRRAVMLACAELEQNGLHVGNVAKWQIEAVDGDVPYLSLRPRTWTRAARMWRSVTPILLDRFPKKKGPTVEELLGEACIRMGLPKPAEIEHGPYPKLKGVAPVPAFRLQRSGESRPRWGVHATVTFDSPVRGPMLLGAGRFFGLGLMRPEWEARDGGV